MALTLPLLLGLPFVGALLAWTSERIRPASGRTWALVSTLLSLVLMAWLTGGRGQATGIGPLEYHIPWIPSFGISFSLALDGLSFVLLWLTALLAVLAVLASWHKITERAGSYYLCLLATLGGITGVFLAEDLFLFYFCWEMMLVPMYFLIGLWGHENRIYAALKFFLFTFISGLFLFAAILTLYWLHAEQTGTYTFLLPELLQTSLSPAEQGWLFAGFFVAFAVKLPMAGLHTWLPDAHTEAPTAGSIILAGLLLKTGAYGLMRFTLPLTPLALESISFYLALAGVIGIFYGAFLAFAQKDLKRLVAYSSVSHMGFVLVALGVNTPEAWQGAVMQLVCHGFSAAALFALVGMIDERFHTRSLEQLGGLWVSLPRLAGFILFFAIASLGLPGLGNFIAELLILLGTFQTWPWLSVAGASALVFAAVYSLKIVQRSVHGPLREGLAGARDLSPREWAILVPLALGLLWLGLAPGLVLEETETQWETYRTARVAQGCLAAGRPPLAGRPADARSPLRQDPRTLEPL